MFVVKMSYFSVRRISTVVSALRRLSLSSSCKLFLFTSYFEVTPALVCSLRIFLMIFFSFFLRTFSRVLLIKFPLFVASGIYYFTARSELIALSPMNTVDNERIHHYKYGLDCKPLYCTVVYAMFAVEFS